MTNKELQEIRERVKQHKFWGTHPIVSPKELDGLLSHIEQLEESSKKWDSIERLYMDAEKRYEYKIEQQTQEIERLKVELNTVCGKAMDFEDTIDKWMPLLEQRKNTIQRLEEALKFYADEQNNDWDISSKTSIKG
jgi:DNA repair exonuclease SbcCD ATPase subunit